MPRCVTVILVLAFGACSAQDTLKLSLNEADHLLVQRSLALIAQHHTIEQAEAERVQARLFNNPTISSEWSMRPATGRFFDVAAPHGQMALHVEQLLSIAGQRGLAIRAANERVRMSEAEYAELAAALRFQLHRALYRQYFTQRAIDAIDSQLEVLGRIVIGFDQQLEKGNVSLREVTRLRTSHFALSRDRSELVMALHELQQVLGTLLSEERILAFTPSTADLIALRPLPTDTATLLDLAQRQRPRILAALANAEAKNLDLRQERRKAIPDLAVGMTYDRNSNYLPDYTGLNLGLSLPLFDRQQGRIAHAKATADQAYAELRLERSSVRLEVIRAWRNAQALQQRYNTTTEGFAEQLDKLSGSLIDNYIKSNLSLLEFTDLFEAYNASIIALNDLEADLQNAYEELEFVSGQRLFPR